MNASQSAMFAEMLATVAIAQIEVKAMELKNAELVAERLSPKYSADDFMRVRDDLAREVGGFTERFRDAY